MCVWWLWEFSHMGPAPLSLPLSRSLWGCLIGLFPVIYSIVPDSAFCVHLRMWVFSISVCVFTHALTRLKESFCTVLDVCSGLSEPKNSRRTYQSNLDRRLIEVMEYDTWSIAKTFFTSWYYFKYVQKGQWVKPVLWQHSVVWCSCFCFSDRISKCSWGTEMKMM